MVFSILFSNSAIEASVDHSDFVEDQSYEKGFAEYFDSEIRPMRRGLEARRVGFLKTIRRRFRKSLLWGGIWLSFWLGGLLTEGFGIEAIASFINWFDGDFYLMITFGPIALLCFWCYMPVMEYSEAVKDEVFTKVVRFFGEDWKYQSKGGFDQNMIDSSDIKPNYNVFSDEDCFCGSYKEIQIDLADVKLINKTRSSDGKTNESLRFRGLCLAFSMNKKFKGKTIAVREAGLFSRNKKKIGAMDRVELEDPDFEKKFEAYGTDQIEARYLLTTAFMDRVLKLAEFLVELGAQDAMEFEFWNENLFIMVPTKIDFFEPKSVFHPAMRIEDLKKFLQEMSLIFGVVDALKLNLDIGL